MKKLVDIEVSTINLGDWLRIMDSVDLDNVEDVKGFAKLGTTIWRELLELQAVPNLTTVGFLEQNAPIYDNWQMLDDEFCCEKTLLRERDRLTDLAKDEAI